MPVTVTTVLAVALGVSLWLANGSTPPATTTTTVAPHNFTVDAVWPTAGSSTRFASAVAAARGFAHEFLSTPTPVIGAPRVPPDADVVVRVRASAGGPVTYVDVRESTPRATWWAMSATTPNNAISTPAPLSVVASPVRLRGRGVAFEGVINVSPRGDRSRAPLASTTVTGGGDRLAPFDASIPFSPGRSRYGDLVLFERSAKDGAVTCASVERVRF